MQKTVVILGMHRSGTSMVGGILQCLNVDLGENQLGKQWSNPLGHFEDLDFLYLNQEILASAGGSWNAPPEYEDILDLKEEYQLVIQSLIKEKEETNYGRPWGWKDPRTSLTIDLYLPFLHQPYFIWCLRDPTAISESLQKRNQIQPSMSMALNDYYNDQINDFTLRNPGLPILSVEYEDLIDAPEIWIGKIVQYLGLESDKGQIQRAIEIILTPIKLRKEKLLVLIIHYITAPGRLFKRIFNGRNS